MTGAGKENLQEVITMKSQFDEGEQKKKLRGEKQNKILNFKRNIGKQEHKPHSALNVSLDTFCYQTIFLK